MPRIIATNLNDCWNINFHSYRPYQAVFLTLYRYMRPISFTNLSNFWKRIFQCSTYSKNNWNVAFGERANLTSILLLSQCFSIGHFFYTILCSSTVLHFFTALSTLLWLFLISSRRKAYALAFSSLCAIPIVSQFVTY